MLINEDSFRQIISQLAPKQVTLVAVSKIKPVEAINALYDLGQRHFGENYVQEMAEKQALLPGDILWHFIGHLQSNKVKYIAPFVHLIHGIDSLKLLKEVNKQAIRNNRIIGVLLQVHIAKEETKFGFDPDELLLPELLKEMSSLPAVTIKGLMGMASFSEDQELVRSEFRELKQLFDKLSEKDLPNFAVDTLSMGMSGDYITAIEEGATMVRIGSLLFGRRS
jgi:pyridoxal phosphate enzyme (YggS family)